MDYYVYEYLREDGTPYYIGKGRNDRWKSKDHNVGIPPKERIRFAPTPLHTDGMIEDLIIALKQVFEETS